MKDNKTKYTVLGLLVILIWATAADCHALFQGHIQYPDFNRWHSYHYRHLYFKTW